MQVHKHMKSYVVCWTTLIWWRESNRLLHLHKQVAWRDSIQFWIILLQKWLPFPMLECTAGIIILSFPSQYPILWWIFGIFVVGSTHRDIVEIIISITFLSYYYFSLCSSFYLIIHQLKLNCNIAMSSPAGIFLLLCISTLICTEMWKDETLITLDSWNSHTQNSRMVKPLCGMWESLWTLVSLQWKLIVHHPSFFSLHFRMLRWKAE